MEAEVKAKEEAEEEEAEEAPGAAGGGSSSDDETPLIRAVRENRLDILQLLVEKGADVNAVSRSGNTALHWAVESRRLDIA